MDNPVELGMTPEEMEAEARLSEMRVEALQQLNTALSGSRMSLPPDGHGTPGQLLWHSPTYGAGQQLMPAGLPAEVMNPDASNAYGPPLSSRERGPYELVASEQQHMTVGQESFNAVTRGPRDRRTVFASNRFDESPQSHPQQPHSHPCPQKDV